MSNSNLVGYVDRRVPVPPSTLRVESILREVYREHGFDLDAAPKDANDPGSRFYLEYQAKRKALTALEMSDRVAIEGMIETLQRKSGKGLGVEAARQVIWKLGVFLSAAGCGHEAG